MTIKTEKWRKMTPEQRLAYYRRRASKARRFPTNTCPASRHLHIMADCLLRKPKKGHADGLRYPMFAEEPQHCAESILAVIADLWEARTELAKAKP